VKNIRSRLYACEVFHLRKAPSVHQFTYHYFTFCLDLDEVEELSKKSLWFGVQKFKPFRFVASDSLLGSECNNVRDLKESVIQFAKRMGVNSPVERVELLAHARTLGYSYNPAAFYFGYDQDDRLLFALVEVTNTFRERKVYFVPASYTGLDEALGAEQKLFYVSPFIDLDTQFEFKLKRPHQSLYIQIDSKKQGSETILHSVLKGESLKLTNANLFFYLLRYPLITLGVMAKIHFQAVRLYLKRVPYLKKSDRPDMQKGGLP